MVISSVSSKASVVFGKEIHYLLISSLFAWSTSLDYKKVILNILVFTFIPNDKLWESVILVPLMIFSCFAVVTWSLLALSSISFASLGSHLA
jgi:hypothetical protein